MDEPVAVLARNAAIQNGLVLLSPCPPQAGYWCSRPVRRPDVRLIRLGIEPRHTVGAQTRDPVNEEPANVSVIPLLLDSNIPM